MSDYKVEIKLGTYTFTINDGDAVNMADPTFVLSDYFHHWEFPVGSPWPGQLAPATSQLRLLTKDVANLSGLDRGTTAWIKVTSAGTLVSNFLGRIDDVDTDPIKRADGTMWSLYTIQMSDYLNDLAELPLNSIDAIELATTRNFQLSIQTAIANGGAFNLSLPTADMTSPTMQLDAKTYVDEPAADAWGELVKQWVRSPFGGNDHCLGTLHPGCTIGGALADIDHVLLRKSATTYGSGVFALTSGVLKIAHNFTSTPGAQIKGLLIDAGLVELDPVKFSRSKISEPDKVSVSGSFGNVTVANATTGPSTLLKVGATITTSGPATEVAKAYLPEVKAAAKWDVDGLTWHPSNAQLAALPWPLCPDPQAAAVDPFMGLVFNAQVVVDRIPKNINPNGKTYYAGQLRNGTVRITPKGKLLYDFALSPRIPLPDTPQVVGVTPADLAANFPAVKVNQVDPTITVYDTRIVRKM